MKRKLDLDNFDPLSATGATGNTHMDHLEEQNHAEQDLESLDAGGGAHNEPNTLPAQVTEYVPDAYDDVESRIYKLVPRMELGADVTRQRRGGRKPKLLRYEVDMIRADGRSTRLIAQHYGVSENTVRRVKQQGVYAGIPYIPADEYIRDVTPEGNSIQPSMRERERARAGVSAQAKPIGRPYASGRGELTSAELVDIASSDRTMRESAAKYNVSVSTIYNIKRRMRGVFPEGMSDIIQVALNDPRTPKQLAEQYGMSEGWFAEVRERGYAMTDDGPATQLKEGDRLTTSPGRRGTT